MTANEFAAAIVAVGAVLSLIGWLTKRAISAIDAKVTGLESLTPRLIRIETLVSAEQIGLVSVVSKLTATVEQLDRLISLIAKQTAVMEERTRE